MHLLRKILARYSNFVWALLKPLGIWGIFGIAAADGALFGLPLDAVVAGYVYQDKSRFWIYTLMAAAGSALGSILLYAIGYKGGEVLLEKRMSAQKFARIRDSFERHEFLALMLPAMLPPPMPFKLFVLSAAAFEMNFWHFLLAVFAGRLVRFTILSILTIKFGPQIANLSAGLAGKHWELALLAIAVLLALWLVLRRLWHRPRAVLGQSR